MSKETLLWIAGSVEQGKLEAALGQGQALMLGMYVNQLTGKLRKELQLDRGIIDKRTGTPRGVDYAPDQKRA